MSNQTKYSQQLYYLAQNITIVNNFPKQGILFRDITPLLKNATAFRTCIDLFAHRYKNQKIDTIIGIEARGFIFGSALAFALGTGFVPARKVGKLPRPTILAHYELEYGTNSLEIHKDSLAIGEKVVIIDDILATGGSAIATTKLLYKLEAELVEVAFLLDLSLGGAKLLEKSLIPYYAMLSV